MNGVIKQDRSDHKSAAAGNEEEKTAKEKSASEVRDGTKLQPPPFAERKNGELLPWCDKRWEWRCWFSISCVCWLFGSLLFLPVVLLRVFAIEHLTIR